MHVPLILRLTFLKMRSLRYLAENWILIISINLILCRLLVHRTMIRHLKLLITIAIVSIVSVFDRIWHSLWTIFVLTLLCCQWYSSSCLIFLLVVQLRSLATVWSSIRALL